MPRSRHNPQFNGDTLGKVLRRRKIDPGIAPELPPKTETDRVVALTAEQATLYAAMVDEIMDQVANAEGIARRGLPDSPGRPRTITSFGS